MLLIHPIEGCSQLVVLHCYRWFGEKGHGHIYRKQQWQVETETLVSKIRTLGMHSQEYASLTFEVSFSSSCFLAQLFQFMFWKKGVHHPALLQLPGMETVF